MAEEIRDKNLMQREKRRATKIIPIVNNNWTTFNHPEENEKELKCDYISFQFKSQLIREKFINLVEYFYGFIPVYSVSYDSYSRYNLPKDKFIFLIEKNNKKQNEFFLHIAGPYAEKITEIMFEDKIIKFVNLNKIEIKRVDLKITFTNHKLDAHEAFFEFLEEQSRAQKDSNSSYKIKSEQSKTGWTVYLEEPQNQWKIRIYLKIEKDSNSCTQHFELELHKSILNKATILWGEKNSSDLLLYLLNQYINKMEIITPNSKFTNIFSKEKLDYVKKWIGNFNKNNFLNKVMIPSLNCSTQASELFTEFLLEKNNEYPAFIAIYLNILRVSREKNLNLESYRRKKYLDLKNSMIFEFSSNSLLDSIGWKKTAHYKQKMMKYLYLLQSYCLVIMKRKKVTGYHSLFSGLNKKKDGIELIVNMKVFTLLMTNFDIKDSSIYAKLLDEYYSTDSKTKATYPNYFYPLVTQTLCADKSHVLYTGQKPLSGTAKIEFKELVRWLFAEALPKYNGNSLSYKEKKVKGSNMTIFVFSNGSFSFDLSEGEHCIFESIIEDKMDKVILCI